jgi:hypothetical protein
MLIALPTSLAAFSETPGPALLMLYLSSRLNVADDSLRRLDITFLVPTVLRDMLDGMLCHWCWWREDALVLPAIYLGILYLLLFTFTLPT